MPDIPYKQLMEDGEPFYPVTGPSSFNGALPVSKGGTGADNAAAARANLGAIGGMIFGEDTALTLTAPADVTVNSYRLYGNKTADGKFLRVHGVVSVTNPNAAASAGMREFALSGISVTPPAAAVQINDVGFRQYKINGEYDTIDFNLSTMPHFVGVKVDTAGAVTLVLQLVFGNANTYSQYFIFPFIIPLA